MLDEVHKAKCAAFQEGMKILNTPGSVETLKKLMVSTRDDENHDEFFVTGTYQKGVLCNSEIQRGFTKEGGLKSSNPFYSQNENILFQSHPSLSPLSLNEQCDFYNPKDCRIGGDLGHIKYAQKNMFVVNKAGDVFYSNPNLVDQCLFENKDCKIDDAQVYLGNIKEFKR